MKAFVKLAYFFQTTIAPLAFKNDMTFWVSLGSALQSGIFEVMGDATTAVAKPPFALKCLRTVRHLKCNTCNGKNEVPLQLLH
jgi:hypothetical protein